MHLVRKASKQVGQPCIPLVPVVMTWNRVELESKMTLRELRSEFAICGQQAFLLSARQKKIWNRLGIRSPDQDKRIVVTPRLASGGTENRVKVP